MSAPMHRDPDSKEHARRATVPGRNRQTHDHPCDHDDAYLIGMSTWCCPDCNLTWRSIQ